MTDRQLLQQALDALKTCEYRPNEFGGEYRDYDEDEVDEAIAALTERLAHCDRCGKRLGGEGDIHTCTPKPEQEPRCAVIVEVFGKDWRLDYMSLPVGKHRLYTQEYVYTTPPAAQPLGYAHWEERIKDLMKQVGMPNSVSLAGAMNQLVNEMMQATPPAAQPTMFGPMGTVGALFDKHVIGRLDKNWRVYVEKNT